jgi:hypothetical protein
MNSYLLDPIRNEVASRLGKQAFNINIIHATMPTKSGVIGAAARLYKLPEVYRERRVLDRNEGVIALESQNDKEKRI